MPNQKRIESMLFNYETTGRTDYRDGEIKPPVYTVYKEKPKSHKLKPPSLKDIHSLTVWKVPDLPFSLLHKPKDIIRTDPRDVQKPFYAHEDKEREHAQATRPRLVMTPAVSMDDVPDKNVRDILIKDMYSTTTLAATEEALTLTGYKNIRAPCPSLPAPANPIYLPRVQPSVVHPEWRRDSVAWDRRQIRSHVDPDREFWKTIDVYKLCPSCKQTAQIKEMRARKV